jgi:hypothetical protein
MARTVLLLFLLSLSFTVPTVSSAATIRLPQTGQFACYSSNGTILPCAGTRQDGALQNGVAWPVPRFSVMSSGGVRDRLTGLMWAKDARTPGTSSCVPGVTKNWYDALSHIVCLNTSRYLGYNDWRLPNIVELKSLVDASAHSPALPLGHPFDNVLVVPALPEDNTYWSSTTKLAYQAAPFSVSFVTGVMNSVQDKQYTQLVVWPVRDSGRAGTVELPRSGQTVCFSNQSQGPCPGTGQDGELQRGTAWPSPRFTDNNNQTLTDGLTGLTWPKGDLFSGLAPAACVSGLTGGNGTWRQALLAVDCLNAHNFLGSSDWRLPNIAEMASLVNYGDPYPASWLTSTQGFGSFFATSQWTSTTLANDPLATSAWIVDMSDGTSGSLPKSQTASLVPVRAGVIPPPPPPVIGLAPESADYGPVVTGSLQSREFVISNAAAAGSGTLRVSSITLGGTNANQFTINLNGGYHPCASAAPAIEPGGTCTLSVGFGPTSLGVKSAVLAVVSNDPLRFSTTSALTGTGVDGTLPVITSFVIPAALASLTVPITSLVATDNVGVTGYCLTETNSFFGCVWIASPPASYVFASPGAKALYLFVRDGIGNISAPASATVVIDLTPPAISSFSLPAVATSLNVPVTLAASDNVKVTGYYLSENGTTPAIGAPGWSASLPAAFAFPAAGPRTLYAWVRDAAGNVSARASATVDIRHLLAVATSGNGIGSVTSSPSGISCAAGSTSGCSAVFVHGATVTLSASPDANSVFDGWSGDCSGTGGCTVTMNGDRSVGAQFVAAPNARIGTTGYDTLLAAYAAAPQGGVIMTRMVEFVELLLLNRDVAITLKGGYDAAFGIGSGMTTLRGSLTVGRGLLTADRLALR